MTKRQLFTLTLWPAFFALLASGASATGESTAAKSTSEKNAVWSHLQKELTGTWQSGGIEVKYRPISSTTIVEEWRAGAKESLTVYAPDGAGVVLTHYCPQGNQPRLAASRVEANAIAFRFVDATNRREGQSMLVALTFQFEAKALVRTETYRDDAGDDEVSVLRFVRARPPPPVKADKKKRRGKRR